MGSDGSIFLLGLTGSIGMGKSTVAGFFKDSGIPVIDSDEIVHRLYGKGGRAVPLMAEAFPGSVIDGEVSRPALSKLVLGNQEALKKLEGIVHPLVSEEQHRILSQLASDPQQGLAVLDVPLLYETNAEEKVDAVAVVSAPHDIQKHRVLARPGMTPEKFEAISARQVPDEVKRARADFVIKTGVTIEETRAQLLQLIASLKGQTGSAFLKSSAWASTH